MQNAFRRNPVLRDYGAFPCPKMGLENEHVVLGGACTQYRSGVGIVGKSIDRAVGIIQAVDRTRQVQHTPVVQEAAGPAMRKVLGRQDTQLLRTDKDIPLRIISVLNDRVP